MTTDRRTMLGALGAAILGSGLSATEARAASSPAGAPKTFVLVHGAWHGGWCYRDVAALLRAEGHVVYTPTLTGLGERRHLGVNIVNLDLHIEDIAQVFEFEELADVILVGHSYAGMVITGVADRLADRIAGIVYLDAYVPRRDGDSIRKIQGSSVGDATAAMGADGWSVAPPPPESFGVKPANRERVARLCTRQPLAPMLQELRLTGKHLEISNRHFVYASGWGTGGQTPFRRFYDELRTEPQWKTHVMPFGHDMMIDEPRATANLLLSI